MPEVALVLLAAGGSRRLGRPKQLLAYQGQTLLRRTAAALLATPCRPLVVVLGAERDRTAAALDGLPVHIVDNPRWADGIGTSIAAGIGTASALGITGAVLALADQPGVTAASIERLLAARAATGQPIVASRYAGTVGVPAYFAAETFPRLRAFDRDQGCKPFILGAGARAAFVDCPEAAVDVDTANDYDALLAAAATPGPHA